MNLTRLRRGPRYPPTPRRWENGWQAKASDARLITRSPPPPPLRGGGGGERLRVTGAICVSRQSSTHRRGVGGELKGMHFHLPRHHNKFLLDLIT